MTQPQHARGRSACQAPGSPRTSSTCLLEARSARLMGRLGLGTDGNTDGQ
jgi:hypothetical protein